MQTNELEKIVLAALEDLKGRDISVLNVMNQCDFTDVMIFCNGTSNRHVRSLAGNVIEKVKEHQFRPLGIEGEDTGEWVLVDLGDIVVHIMLTSVRDFYQLEQLWGMQPED